MDNRHSWYAAVSLTFLVLFTYSYGITTLPIRGEESRRALVAWEMQANGDWIVPRQQGEPFLSRPPLGSWGIAITSAILGRGEGAVDLLATRLPTVLATLLTTWLVYIYARTFFLPEAALGAGLAYPTMIQVLELGRVAETEATFTLFVAGSLLLWHLGWRNEKPERFHWIIGYALAGLATLAKGPQAPVYFLAGCSALLLWRGLASELWKIPHLLGVLTFVAIVGCWQIPFQLSQGWAGVRAVYGGDVALRFEDVATITIVKHFFTYPLEVLVCTGPWSWCVAAGLMIPAIRRQWRDAFAATFFTGPITNSKSSTPAGAEHGDGSEVYRAGRRAEAMVFIFLCLLLSFPTCWLPPGARARYYMPMYPCIAVFVGSILDGWLRADAGRCAERAKTLAWQAPMLACSLALGYCFCLLPWFIARGENLAGAVALLKKHLPADVSLVSFGQVHHLFVYHYRAPITMVPWPTNTDVLPSDEYFCFDRIGQSSVELPFPWEEVTVLSCDRYRQLQPRDTVVIGRRLSTPTSTTTTKIPSIPRLATRE